MNNEEREIINKTKELIDELKSIKTENDYINFCDKYERLINYMPEFKTLICRFIPAEYETA